MDLLDIVRDAFEDEITKIAAGTASTGVLRNPVGKFSGSAVQKWLKSASKGKLAEAKAEAVKDAAKAFGWKAPALVGVGGLGYHLARTAEMDRRLGKQVRRQQGQ